jgi:lysophospholipase
MDWPQPAGNKLRGSLVFAGGRGDFIEKYLEAFDHWHMRGWDVTGFDWRGQGESQGAEFEFVSFDPLIDDCAALLADWATATPGPHVAVGHSMGGHLLLRTLVERQPALDATVLIAPMIRVNSAPLPAWLAPDIADCLCRLGLRNLPMWKMPPGLREPGSARQRNLTGSLERYADEGWWWARHPTWDLGAPTWGWLRAAFRSAASAFCPERLARVSTPVLILAAARDRLVSLAEIRRVAAALPQAELEVFEEAAHEILREADPVRNRALARIDAFLAGQAG